MLGLLAAHFTLADEFSKHFNIASRDLYQTTTWERAKDVDPVSPYESADRPEYLLKAHHPSYRSR